jgi:hypothetical protein
MVRPMASAIFIYYVYIANKEFPFQYLNIFRMFQVKITDFWTIREGVMQDKIFSLLNWHFNKLDNTKNRKKEQKRLLSLTDK